MNNIFGSSDDESESPSSSAATINSGKSMPTGFRRMSPVPIPLSLASTTSASAASVGAAEDQQKKKHQKKSLVSKTASFRPVPATAPSPYERGYCAEDGEPLFTKLSSALSDGKNCDICRYNRIISDTQLLYSPTWMSSGIVQDHNVGKQSADCMILCLQVKFIAKGEATLLKTLAVDCQMDKIVREALVQWNWADKYPQVTGTAPYLLKIKSRAALKSLLFLARVVCALNFLKESHDMLKESPNLQAKIRQCLDVLEAAAVEKQAKKRGRKSKAVVTPASATNKPSRTVNGANKLLVEFDEDDDDEEEDTQEKSTKRVPKRRPSKKRRVSVDATSTIASAGDTVEEDLTTASILNRFDMLEQHFQDGLTAIRKLRLDFQKKDENYKTALNNQIWANSQNANAAVIPSSCNTSTTKSQASTSAERKTEPDAKQDEGLRKPEIVAERVRAHVREVVFPGLKFLKNKETCKRVTRDVAGMISNLGMSLDEWVDLYGPEVKKAFDWHGETVLGSMKLAVFKFLDEHNGSLRTVEELSKLRQSKTLTEQLAFQWFWDSLLECVAGETTWGETKHQKLMSDADAVTISDEAFTLFLFENCREQWICEWKNEKEKGLSIPVPPGLYNSGGEGFHPWSKQGFERYKALLKHVKEDRGEMGSKEAEKRILNQVRLNHELTVLS